MFPRALEHVVEEHALAGAVPRAVIERDAAVPQPRDVSLAVHGVGRGRGGDDSLVESAEEHVVKGEVAKSRRVTAVHAQARARPGVGGLAHAFLQAREEFRLADFRPAHACERIEEAPEGRQRGVLFGGEVFGESGDTVGDIESVEQAVKGRRHCGLGRAAGEQVRQAAQAFDGLAKGDNGLGGLRHALAKGLDIFAAPGFDTARKGLQAAKPLVVAADDLGAPGDERKGCVVPAGFRVGAEPW